MADSEPSRRLTPFLTHLFRVLGALPGLAVGAYLFLLGYISTGFTGNMLFVVIGLIAALVFGFGLLWFGLFFGGKIGARLGTKLEAATPTEQARIHAYNRMLLLCVILPLLALTGIGIYQWQAWKDRINLSPDELWMYPPMKQKLEQDGQAETIIAGALPHIVKRELIPSDDGQTLRVRITIDGTKPGNYHLKLILGDAQWPGHFSESFAAGDVVVIRQFPYVFEHEIPSAMASTRYQQTAPDGYAEALCNQQTLTFSVLPYDSPAMAEAIERLAAEQNGQDAAHRKRTSFVWLTPFVLCTNHAGFELEPNLARSIHPPFVDTEFEEERD